MKKVRSLDKKALWHDGFSKHPFARIHAVQDTDMKAGATAVGKRVSEAVAKGKNDMLKQLSLAYRLLQNLERTTQEYTAKQSKGMNTPDAQLKYVEQIGKDYSSTKKNYIEIFTGVDTAASGRATTSDTHQTKFKTAAGLTESKSPLDQLIEAVAKQKLLK